MPNTPNKRVSLRKTADHDTLTPWEQVCEIWNARHPDQVVTVATVRKTGSDALARLRKAFCNEEEEHWIG